jgi:ribosomal protein L24E
MKQRKCQWCGYEFQPSTDYYHVLVTRKGLELTLICPNDCCRKDVEFHIVQDDSFITSEV